MEDLFTVIKEWPVIIQGALGSALFAVTLFLVQLIITMMNNIISNYSDENRKKSLLKLHRKYTGLKAYRENDLLTSSSIQIGLIYTTLRDFLKGSIWIGYG